MRLLAFLFLFSAAELSVLGQQGYEYEKTDVSLYRENYAPFKYPAIADSELVTTKPLPEPPVVPGITIDIPKELQLMMEKHKQLFMEDGEYDGFRIQIHSSNERDASNEMKLRFIETCPDIAIYQLYIPPSYRLRVGDFTNRAEAEAQKEKLMPLFPGAFVVKETVKVKKSKLREEE